MVAGAEPVRRASSYARLCVALPASCKADRSEEDAEGDRQYSAVAQEGARAAGYGNGGEGHETPGGQLHACEISGAIQGMGATTNVAV